MTPAERIAERARTVTVDTRAGRLRIRPPRPTEGAALHALVQAVLAEGQGFVSHPDEQPLAPDALAARLVDEDARPTSFVGVGTLAGDPVGLVILEGGRRRRLRHVARLEVRVAAAARGQGVGRALVERALAVARGRRGLTKLSLAVFADNAAALGLYRSLGFVEEGRRRGEYLEDDGRLRDDVLMALAV